MSAVLTPRSAARARSICTRSSGLSRTSVLSRSVKPPTSSERRFSSSAYSESFSISGPRSTKLMSKFPPGPKLNEPWLRTATRTGENLRSRRRTSCMTSDCL